MKTRIHELLRASESALDAERAAREANIADRVARIGRRELTINYATGKVVKAR